MVKKSADIFLIALLLLAAILRLVRPFQIPMTYDEVTEFIRTHYNSLSEEIKQGIMLHDNHPAGVQLFIYFWTKVFGYNELLVKLPFIAFGVLAVYYTYKVGQGWFNNTVALVCAAYMATLQYPVMYSQEIRPYISGLFVAIAMVYYWDKVVFKPETNLLKNSLLYILFSALCAYDHHFCLLFAAMVGITGLFFIEKRYLLKYIVAGGLIFVLYIPHLHIFFYQLHKGGIGGPDGWLGVPRNTFILDYLYYVFQFSNSVILFVIALFLFGIYYAFRNGVTNKKYFVISLCWFLVPLLTGLFYSVYVNPVLQYSVLIFGFPFLLFCLFGLLPELHRIFLAGLLTIICIINIHSLVKVRKHYTLFYKSAYEQPILINDSLSQSFGRDSYECVIQSDDSDKNVSKYYIRKNDADTSFHFTDNLGCYITHPTNYSRFINFMDNQHTQYFGFGYTAQFDPIVLNIITNYYPYLVKRWDYAGGTFYLLSKVFIENSPAFYTFQSANDFESDLPNWDKPERKFLTDSIHYSGQHSYKIDSAHEWAPGFSCLLNTISWNKNDIVEIALELYPKEELTDVMLVASLEVGGKTIEWRATPVTEFTQGALTGQWFKAYHTLKLQDLKTTYMGTTLKVYLWNKGKKNFYIDDFSVKTLKGNPVIYGLFEKI